jgi:histidinol-phosphate aminotransferase
MDAGLSRRGLIGMGMGAGAIAALASARAAAGAPGAPPPLFGPGKGIALLSRNENPYGPAPSAVRAMAEWAGKGCYYADTAHARLTAMIAERHGVTPDHVVVGSGSTEVLSAAALAFGASGTILAPELFWDTTVRYGEAKGAKVRRVAMTADLGIDLPAIAAAVTPDVSLVHICNPNNPTGRILDGAALAGFVRTVGPKATVLVDEAYNELADWPEAATVMGLVKAGENLIVCRTFSKIYGMAGLRVGYAVTQPAIARRLAGYLMSFGGNSAGLAAAIAAFDDTAFLRFSRERVLEGRAILTEAVRRAGTEALPSQANFLFVKVPDAERLRAAMAARGIMIRGAYGPLTGWSRVSTGRIEDVRRYAEALPALIGA